MRSVVPGMAFIHYSFNFKWSFVDTFLGSLHSSTSGGRTFVVITTFDVNISKHLLRRGSKLGVCRCFLDLIDSLMPSLERIIPHKSRVWMCVVLCRVFITALSGARQSRTARPPPPSVTQREPRPTLTHAATTTTGHWLHTGTGHLVHTWYLHTGYLHIRYLSTRYLHTRYLHTH